MRILSSARIVVLDACPEHRAFLCSGLSGLGMLRVLPAASADEAQRIGAEQAPDLCVVDPRRLPNAIAEVTPRIPVNPFDPARTPGILIAVDATRETLKAAAASGYSVVLALPVVPRLLYRRIGSLLQRVRRTDRRNEMKLVVEAAAVSAELQER